MKEFIEKLICRLEEEKSNVPVNRLLDDIIKDKPKELGQLIAYNKAIEIVKQEAEQYNNGWIPCSERLPEEDGEYEVTFEHTYHGDIKYKTKRAWFEKGYWSTQYNVVAWKNISEPYQPKGE